MKTQTPYQTHQPQPQAPGYAPSHTGGYYPAPGYGGTH